MSRRSPRSAAIAVAAAVLLTISCAVPRWPVDGVLTSPYGLRFRGLRPDLHRGVDIAAPAGSPVFAMRSGRVAFAGPLSGYGLTVVIDHGPSLTSTYAHLSRILVATGDAVTRETSIGLVGATGNATAPHLHFEIRRHGRHDDPVPLLGRFPHP